MDEYGARRVTVTGHSLGKYDRLSRACARKTDHDVYLPGAAIALLDFAFLPLHLPNGTNVRFVGYGTPRVRIVNSALHPSR